jgi:predicted GIY-YIG superfamily endonuclease
MEHTLACHGKHGRIPVRLCRDERRYVAYVGIGDDLHRRIRQHLVDRNSSATTRTGAVA